MQDGQKKETATSAKVNGHFIQTPKVYHIVTPKGKNTMIELKITATTADELTADVKDLYSRIVGAPMIENIEEVGTKVELPEEKPKKAKAKAATKVEPKVEEAPKAEEPAKAAEEKTYTVDEVRAAAKDFAQKDPANKKKIAEFLHNELGVKSITEAPADVYPRIIEFVGAN